MRLWLRQGQLVHPSTRRSRNSRLVGATLPRGDAVPGQVGSLVAYFTVQLLGPRRSTRRAHVQSGVAACKVCVKTTAPLAPLGLAAICARRGRPPYAMGASAAAGPPRRRLHDALGRRAEPGRPKVAATLVFLVDDAHHLPRDDDAWTTTPCAAASPWAPRTAPPRRPREPPSGRARAAEAQVRRRRRGDGAVGVELEVERALAAVFAMFLVYPGSGWLCRFTDQLRVVALVSHSSCRGQTYQPALSTKNDRPWRELNDRLTGTRRPSAL